MRRTELLRSEIPIGTGSLTLLLVQEDYTDTYPGMARYLISVMEGANLRAAFQTNTYEYTPASSLNAEEIARTRARIWEDEIRSDKETFFARHPLPRPRVFPYSSTDIVVVQGSPRAEGNSGILARWVVERSEEKGKTAQVFFPHDMDIHHCIGCYQCYNTGYCVFDDDMGTVIASFDDAHLVVFCTPVYTMTVPAGLKLLMDRCQSYHAKRLLYDDRRTRKGLLLSVAGRKGRDNFACMKSTVHAFMRNLGMIPAEDILVDDMDAARDIRTLPQVRESVRNALDSLLDA